MTTILISAFSALIAGAAVVFIGRYQIDLARGDSKTENDKILVKPTLFSVCLLIFGAPALLFSSALLMVIVLSVPLSLSGVLLLTVAVGFFWLVLSSIYTVFIIRIKFSNDHVWYRGLFKKFTVSWDDVISINKTRLRGLVVKTTKGLIPIWAWSRGVGDLLKIAERRNLPITSTVPISVTKRWR